MSRPHAKPVPEGMHAITPHLVLPGRGGAQGKLMRELLRIGDSPLTLVDEFPEWGASSPQSLKGSPVTLHLSN